jgi:uncharacterized protein (TIGR03790 family)
MKKYRLLFLILIYALAPVWVHAGGNEVVVIYNTRVPGSESVADYYAKVRNVPKKQIYGFSLTADETMSRDEFRDAFQLPLARRLEYDGLWRFGSVTNVNTNGEQLVERRLVSSKIRYAVLCYGVPLKIAPDPNLHETLPQGTPPQWQRNEAAVDSELAWLPLLDRNLTLSGPMQNWVYGTTNESWLNPTNGILMVARLDGPTPEIARGLVDKALEAERNGLWGRAYFDLRDDTSPNYKIGDDWIRGAAEICRELGFETVMDEKPGTFPASFPMSHIAIYEGWYDENVSGPFASPKVEFMPGAFAYHLHSFSAATLRSTTEHWVGPLLAKGATCTMGCVYEPYLQATPNLTIFTGRFLANGFTFGEAAWAAQPALSWQTTVVGDPLYRPFGKSPMERHIELTRSHNKLLEWSDLQVANLAIIHGASLAQAANYLENIGTTTNSAVLTEKLADLYSDLGKPSSAIATYERALKLGPSPEQRIRIRLALGNKLLTANREADAINNYKKLLKESPHYPGKNSIEEKLATLENKNAAAVNSSSKP